MDKIATVVKMKDKRLLIELDEPVSEEFIRLLHRDDDEPIQIEMRFVDPRKITPEQRKLIHCLIEDIAKATGTYLPGEMKETIKQLYREKTGKYISFSNCERIQASEVIEMLLEIILTYDIQLSRRYNYLLNDNKFFYLCVKHRTCCVCGKPHADIHHAVGSVGMGRNRRRVDHSQYGLEALCREHHTECHKIGQSSFDSKYKLIPVYLGYDDIYRLNLMNKGFFEDLEYHRSEVNEHNE